jgi:DNA (cytosine-5)-methyltransferase 1
MLFLSTIMLQTTTPGVHMTSLGRTSHKLRSLEVFSGAGGLALATHEAGFRHEAVVEWNRDACATLRENSVACGGKDTAWNVIEGDIRDFNAGHYAGIDLLAGGPPCQPFSIGGKHNGSMDKRDMIPEFIRCVRDAAPRAFIMENVKGLTRPTFKNYFSYSVLQLRYPDVLLKRGESWAGHLARLEDIHTKGGKPGLSYRVVHQVLNAADYGVPQTRERVFVVGFRCDQHIAWHFPEPTHSKEALLFDQWGSGGYWKRVGAKRAGEPPSARKMAAQNELLNPCAPWRTLREAIKDLPIPGTRESARFLNHRLQTGAKAYPGHTGSHIDWPSKALKAGDHGVPGGENMILYPDGEVRYLTVREAARVQTFPDQWGFQGAWTEAMRQLGNAVPVQLANKVAQSVADALQGR